MLSTRQGEPGNRDDRAGAARSRQQEYDKNRRNFGVAASRSQIRSRTFESRAPKQRNFNGWRAHHETSNIPPSQNPPLPHPATPLARGRGAARGRPHGHRSRAEPAGRRPRRHGQFSVTATGAGPFTYAWQLSVGGGAYGTLSNGTRIAGAGSSTLQISNLQASDAGNYRAWSAMPAASPTPGLEPSPSPLPHRRR